MRDSPPRAVLLDLDGTLYHQKPLRRRMVRALLSHCARRPLQGRRLLKTLSTFRRAREGLRVMRPPGLALEDAQYAVPANLLGMPMITVAAIVQEWMHERPLPHLKKVVRADLVPFLDRCKAQGIKLGVFSDYPPTAKLDAMGLGDRFDTVLGATDPEIDAFKPDPKGYAVACTRWQIPAEECLYVGDREEIDGAGAVAAGMPCAILGTPDDPTDLPPTVHFVPSFDALASALGI